MHERPYDIFDSFADELIAEKNVRSLTIVAAAKIDALLAEILAKYFRPKVGAGNQPDELLDGDNPLSTFSSRIKACYRLGLIGDRLFRTLEQLRKIRNMSAHTVSFEPAKSPLREHFREVSKLTVGRRSFTLTRVRFFESESLSEHASLQCQFLTLCALLEKIKESTVPVTALKDGDR